MDIFLSYSREDQVVARRFAGGFEREGLSVWWDQSLTPGEAFDQVTERALEEAKAVIVLWSKSSVNSRWVRAEATQANADHRLVPVMIEHCKRPIMFELTHTADLSEWQGNTEDPEWQSFVANVRQFVQHPADPPLVARAPRVPVGPSVVARATKALKRVMKFGVGTAIALALAAVAAGIAWKLRSPPDHEITRFAVDLAAPLNSISALALAPNGRRIVYGIGAQLYSRRLDQDESTPIPGAEAAHDPFFSPDSKSVAFFTPTQLKAFDFDGEAVRVIADIKPAPGLVGAWDPQGRIFFGLGGAFGLSWVPAVGGVPEDFAKLANYADLDYPDVLPGGEWVLFSANITAADWSGSDIVAQNVSTGERKIVLKGGHFARYLPTGHLVFARNGTMFAIGFDAKHVATRGRAIPVAQGVATNELSGHAQFAVAANGTLIYVPGEAIGRGGAIKTVVSVSPTGESTVLSADPRAYSNPRASPDGSRIAVEVASADKTVQIWVMEVATGAAAQLTFDGDENRFPVWTTDGHEILFTSRRGKEFSIYRKPADGTGEARRVLSGTNDLAPTDVHGHILVFQDRVEGNARDILTLDLDAQDPPRPLLATPADESSARVSPSGSWVAYTSAERGASTPDPRVFARPFRDVAGGQRAISEGSGIDPTWSTDGNAIYYIGFGGGQSSLVSVPVAVTSTITPSGSKNLFAFFPRFDITTAGTRYAVPYEPLPKGGFLAIEATAAKLSQSPGAPQDRPRIIVVLNWVDELRRLAPAE